MLEDNEWHQGVDLNLFPAVEVQKAKVRLEAGPMPDSGCQRVPPSHRRFGQGPPNRRSPILHPSKRMASSTLPFPGDARWHQRFAASLENVTSNDDLVPFVKSVRRYPAPHGQ